MAHDHDHLKDHEHVHTHTHNEADMRAIRFMMARAIGHFEAVKKMVEDGADCSDVLIQLAAVKSAVNNVGRELLKEHLSHCIVDAIEHNDKAAIEALNSAIDSFVK